MPTAPALTDDQIAICRELLLAEICSGKGKKTTQKEALKKMLGVVLAARNAGISFETICTVMHRAGISITVETLKKYYFELRKELEISIAERAHAKRIATAKAAIESRMIVREAHEVAKSSKSFIPKLGTSSQRAQIVPDLIPSVISENLKPKSTRGTETKRTKAEDHAAPRQPESKGNTAQKESHAEKVIQLENTFNGIQNEDGAMTLEELAKISEEREKDKSYEHPYYDEMLIVREGRVYLESGRPFTGTLLSTQIFLLRKNRKLFPPPPPSRTSKDFVKMRRVL